MSDPRDEPVDDEPIIERATDWLNGKLYGILGPPPLGPYGLDPGGPQAEAAEPCPICGRPLGEHRAEVDRGHTYLHHPDATFSDVLQVD